MDALYNKKYEERVFAENLKYLAIALFIIALILAGLGEARAEVQQNIQTKAYPDGWSSDLMVSYKAINGYHPEGWTDSKGNVHIVWDDNEDDIYYAQVDESGAMVVSQKPLTQLSY
ncbi:MAG TPA: hypothetical protein PK467_20000, partial [Candidatus Wallbacteria bacterium]|nr:hypothetical protein [Candidatus Wallbacteria bacterium]